jgi:hypothetical protein
MKYIITFEEVSGSLRTEQVLKRLSYPCSIDAAPRNLSASCVYIIRTQAESPEEIEDILRDAKIHWTQVLVDDNWW